MKYKVKALHIYTLKSHPIEFHLKGEFLFGLVATKSYFQILYCSGVNCARFTDIVAFPKIVDTAHESALIKRQFTHMLPKSKKKKTRDWWATRREVLNVKFGGTRTLPCWIEAQGRIIALGGNELKKGGRLNSTQGWEKMETLGLNNSQRLTKLNNQGLE